MAVVGIDLGTTNTVVAAVRDGRAATLKDKLGRALLPSVVSFSPRGEPKVGYEAKTRRTLDPENTVFSIKRLIGRSWDGPHVEKARSRFPFELREGPGKATLVRCQGRDYTLPEISALVLTAAREIAEQRLAQQVSAAVITVPANFNDLQRAATKVAGRVAGLEVLRIVNEPTAAALAYGFGKRGRERIAVYDFGGGTFDVTLLDLSENVFEVLSTAGDTFLGGDDLDQEIVDLMGEELLKKHRIDMSQDNLVVEQLRAAAEKLKMDLSTRSMGRATIKEIGYVGGKTVDFEFNLRRADFEKLAEPFIERTLSVCQEALDIAGVEQKDLDQVLLVGGSTKIPLVRRRISSFFGRMPQSRINPDEVVAIGAAIQAAALEARSGIDQVPSAPMPASLTPQSRLPGGTKMGLAAPPPQRLEPLGGGPGSQGARGDDPVFPRQSGKTLSGVGEPTATGLPTSEDFLADSMSGVGEARGPRTLSGIGEPPSQDDLARLVGKTPRLHSTDVADEDQTVRLRPGTTEPDDADEEDMPTGKFKQSAFDDITSVLKRPDQVARLHDMQVAQRLQEKQLTERQDLRERQGPAQGFGETQPGPGPRSPAEPPPPATDQPESRTEEGSVTFDLAELEAEAEAKAGKAQRQASTTDVADLPAVVRHRIDEIEEVSGVLEMPEDDDDLEADLPSIAPRSLATLTSSPPPEREQTDLPELAPQLPSVMAGLPQTTKAGRPGLSDVGLPIVSRAELPVRSQASLPERFSTSGTAPAVSSGRPPLDLFDEEDMLGDTGILGSLPAPDPREPLESVSDLSPGQDAYRTSLASIDESIDAVLSSPVGGVSRTATRPGAARERSAPGHSGSAPESFPRAGGRQSERPARFASEDPAPPLLIDVTPLALGVETVGGFVDTMIERNNPIPCERTHTFTTARDMQQVVRVRVSQGQGNRFTDNTLLGEVELRGLKQGPRGSVRVDVTFALDESGILQVSAKDQETGQAADARLKLIGIGDPNAEPR